MEHNRKMAIIGLGSVITLIALLFIFNPQAETKLPSYWIGLIVGGIFGIFSCLYIAIAWGPIDMRSGSSNAKKTDPRWMPIAVIGGIITARITSTVLMPEIGMAIDNCLITWIVIVLGYVVIQIWSRRS
jgi:H+/Cl- antiporter ClcA